MANINRLVSWIGNADLISMTEDFGEEGKKLLEAAKIKGKYGKYPGPLKIALQEKSFNEVHLLSNYPSVVHKPFAKWLGSKPTIHSVDLAVPTDYEGIFRSAINILEKITKRPRGNLSILLSPGTPAMAVIWVLLGSSRYPATFYQTNKDKLEEAIIPTDLFEEMVPDLIRDRDIALQHLASESPREVEGFEEIIGDSRAIRDAVGRAKRAALKGVSVLLLGKSGTGKELFAQAIHKASPRRDKVFWSINCAALSKTLLESELFGHVKGAFTGADKERKGAFELADGGTLFLDEIGECELEVQAKLLRVLQPIKEGPAVRKITRLGDDRERTVDVRIIAATNRDLHKRIKENEFREDLYYRLAGMTVTLPPLTERKTDVPAISDHLLNQINSQFKKEDPGYIHKKLSESTKRFIKKHDWPGNVRQLSNALVQAAVLADKEILEPRDLIAALGEMPTDDTNLITRPLGDGFSLDEYLDEIHRNYLQRAMEEARGVKKKASLLLGIENYQTLDARLQRLNVDGNWKK